MKLNWKHELSAASLKPVDAETARQVSEYIDRQMHAMAQVLGVPRVYLEPSAFVAYKPLPYFRMGAMQYTPT